VRGSLVSIGYRTWLRVVEPKRKGCSVDTFADTELMSGERILLPGGQDLPILCFRIEQASGGWIFVHTGKLGTRIAEYPIIPQTDSIKAEYRMRVKIGFLFKVDVSRLHEIPRFVDDFDNFARLYSIQAHGIEKEDTLIFLNEKLTTFSI